MTLRGLYLILLLAPVASEAGGIYRCESDGVVEFSDRPCGLQARSFELSPISVVEPDENLPALAESSRRFIEERRRRLSESRRPRPADQTAPARVPPPAIRQPVYVPWLVPVPRDHHRVEPRLPPSHFQQRYSPLHGPILGTRRDRTPRLATRFENQRKK